MSTRRHKRSQATDECQGQLLNPNDFDACDIIIKLGMINTFFWTDAKSKDNRIGRYFRHNEGNGEVVRNEDGSPIRRPSNKGIHVRAQGGKGDVSH